MKTLIFGVVLLFFGVISSASVSMPSKIDQASVSSPCTVYFASALFSMREKNFNTAVASRLEKNHHYKVFLPQRDGFEFSDLNSSLAKYLDADEALKADKIIIYSLDMGYFLLNSNVVVAVLDEELDPGVIVEVSYGRLMGKYTIGIRTDVRSPYGPDSETGSHFFPLFQLSSYIFFNQEAEVDEEMDPILDEVSNLIDQKIKAYNQTNVCSKPPANILAGNSVVQNFQKAANILFHGMTLEQINSKEGLKIIVERYLANKEELSKLYPSVR